MNTTDGDDIVTAAATEERNVPTTPVEAENLADRYEQMTRLADRFDDAGEEMRRRAKEMEAELRKLRPDLIGGITAWHGDGSFTDVAYFTSEQEARKNEGAMGESPLFEQYMSLIDGDLTFYDLTNLDLD